MTNPAIAIPAIRTNASTSRQDNDTLPHRQIEEDPIIVVRSQIRGVPFARLQAPHEARTPVGQRVDLVKTGHEASHDRAFERSFHSAMFTWARRMLLFILSSPWAA